MTVYIYFQLAWTSMSQKMFPNFTILEFGISTFTFELIYWFVSRDSLQLCSRLPRTKKLSLKIFYFYVSSLTYIPWGGFTAGWPGQLKLTLRFLLMCSK